MTRRNSHFVRGLGLGAGLMYLLDPERGPRRRAWVRDKAVHTRRELAQAADVTSRDLSQRVHGLAARWNHFLGRRGAEEAHGRGADDALLTQRVRSVLGRYVSHPHALDVLVHDGVVTLSGPILTRERDPVVHRAGRVRGVREVVDQLDPHPSADGIPALQGGVPRRPRPELLQDTWAPAPRLVAGLIGGALALFGVARVRRQPLRGIGALVSGKLLLLRAVTNMPLARLSGIGAGRRAIDFHKTIEVNRPLEEVFRFWSHFENFPKFMEHVRAVTVTGDRTSHWKVAGPAGTAVEWDAEITRFEPEVALAWKTLPGAAIEHAGVIRFERTPHNGTRLDIRLSYNPAAGALGHAVAALFRADPKSAMDDDLVRFKSLLESGKATAHGTTVTREELIH